MSLELYDTQSAPVSITCQISLIFPFREILNIGMNERLLVLMKMMLLNNFFDVGERSECKL